MRGGVLCEIVVDIGGFLSWELVLMVSWSLVWDGMVDWGECGDGEGGEVKVIKEYVFGTTG